MSIIKHSTDTEIFANCQENSGKPDRQTTSMCTQMKELFEIYNLVYGCLGVSFTEENILDNRGFATVAQKCSCSQQVKIELLGI